MAGQSRVKHKINITNIAIILLAQAPNLLNYKTSLGSAFQNKPWKIREYGSPSYQIVLFSQEKCNFCFHISEKNSMESKNFCFNNEIYINPILFIKKREA